MNLFALAFRTNRMKTAAGRARKLAALARCWLAERRSCRGPYGVGVSSGVCAEVFTGSTSADPSASAPMTKVTLLLYSPAHARRYQAQTVRRCLPGLQRAHRLGAVDP